MRAIHEFTSLLREVRNELAAVRAPVIVLHGGRDRTISPANAAEIEGRLVCSRDVVRRSFPRSGHGMSVDVDREEINAAVLQWFNRHSRLAAVTPAAVAQVPG
jgi:esterase/lipase